MPVTNVDWETRIIPARAGQTPPNSPFRRFHPDHPRACGANGMVAVANRQIRGSSPRVRGKSASDHPRACGANLRTGCGAAAVRGSSPRVRGKRGRRLRRRPDRRIIPARAGQTAAGARGRAGWPDHPRACGANKTISKNEGITDGSSPRVRGKHRRRTFACPLLRIIPARAGQTVRFYAKTLERWTLNNWIRTVAPIFVLLFLLPVIGQNAYIERHYSNQSFSWFSKLHYASAFDLSLVA